MSELSIWRGTAGEAAFPILEGKTEADVAIVGGGITGITLAMLLCDAGRSVVLIEANTIGYGSTGDSTGNLYEVLSNGLKPLGDKWGRDVMQAVALSRREAMSLVAQTASRFSLDCAYKPCTLYRYATETAAHAEVDAEHEMLAELGLPVRPLQQVPVAVPHARGFALDNQAQFHPLAYLRGVAQRIASPKCRIHEHSAMVAIDEDDGVVHTARGSVRATEIVLATHTPKGIFLVHTEMQVHREYGLALRLNDGPYPDGTFWGRGEYRHSLRGVRALGKDYLIVVGEEHKTGEKPEVDPFSRLETFARSHFDVEEVAYQWSAQNYRAADGLPYIGRSHTSDLFIATGFATDGLTYGTLAGRLLCDQILGRDNGWSDIYRANRMAPVKSAKGVLQENITVASALLRDYGRRPQATLAELAPGEGAVVELAGERLAAYRDESGEVSVLSAICPHMKCVVHWNGAEKTWDCPCHGSRFGLSGAVIEGPAMAPLQRHEVPD